MKSEKQRIHLERLALSRKGLPRHWKVRGMTGLKHSKEARKKMSESSRGQIPWNKGKPHTEETKKKMKGSSHHLTPNKGKHHSEETRKKMSESHKGEKSGNWKGGVTPINLKIRMSLEYKLWRESVFKRDNYTCLWCGTKGNINADHIKRFSEYPELRFAIDNGRTLCVPCHKTTETYGNKEVCK